MYLSPVRNPFPHPPVFGTGSATKSVAPAVYHPYLKDGAGVGVLSAAVTGPDTRGTQLNARPVVNGSTWISTPRGTSLQQAIASAQQLAQKTGALSAVLQATEGVGPWIVSTRSEQPLVALGIVDSAKHPFRADHTLSRPFAERVARYVPEIGHVTTPTLAFVGEKRALVFDSLKARHAHLVNL